MLKDKFTEKFEEYVFKMEDKKCGSVNPMRLASVHRAEYFIYHKLMHYRRVVLLPTRNFDHQSLTFSLSGVVGEVGCRDVTSTPVTEYQPFISQHPEE